MQNKIRQITQISLCSNRLKDFLNINLFLQFVLFLYSLTYVAAWFSGMGLIILFILAVFTLPKTYELYKEVREHDRDYS